MNNKNGGSINHIRGDNIPHILGASANLLGLCFIIITYLKNLGYAKQTIIDKAVGMAAIFFAISCLFSFLSMREDKYLRIERREFIADIAFFMGIIIIVIVIIANVFSIF